MDAKDEIIDFFDKPVVIVPPKILPGMFVKKKHSEKPEEALKITPFIDNNNKIHWKVCLNVEFGSKFIPEEDLEFISWSNPHCKTRKFEKVVLGDNEYILLSLVSGISAGSAWFATNSQNNRLYSIKFHSKSEANQDKLKTVQKKKAPEKINILPPKPEKDYKNPKELAEDIQKTIIGQKDVVKKMAVAAFDQIKRPSNVKKANILILGPTGCGKTYVSRTASRLIGVPFEEIKISAVSTTGYKGYNFASIFDELGEHRKEPGFMRSIVFIDEIDKLAAKGENKSGFGSGLQNELIAFIESANYRSESGYYNSGFSVDTTDILFICAGAFTGIEDIIAERIGVRKLEDGTFELPLEELYSKIISDDFVKYGLKPELMGRLPIITYVKPLAIEDLVKILKESKNSVIAQQLQLLKEGYGLSVEIQDGVYETVAKAAYYKGVGARALETIANDLFMDIKYDVGDLKKKDNLKIDTELAEKIMIKHSHSLEKPKNTGGKKVGFRV